MTKKLLFATLSLAALAACTDNDFESQQKVAEELTCPVKFTVINNDAQTRAYMDGSTIRWQATTGDLFTLYHGVPTGALDITTGYWNAAYKTESDGSQASLSTPTMIKEGYAVMFWPVDTTFRIKPTDALSIEIPEVLEAKTDKNPKGGIENHIPYVSDLIEIKAYDPTGDGSQIGNKNTAGKDREYPVYMRPMASQLTINADYGDTYAEIQTLEDGEDGIDPIKVTSIDLLTDAGSEFTKEIPVTFNDPTPEMSGRWAAATGKNAGNNWKKVTTLNVGGIAAEGKTTKLTTKCLDGNAACKFLILPQTEMDPADPAVFVKKAAVVVNTIYGRVLVGDPAEYDALPLKSYYEAGEYNEAWYRYVTANVAPAATDEETAGVAGTGDFAGKFKVVAKNPKLGMKQTINFITKKVASSGLVKDEPVGTSLNRYVKVNLQHLDMSDLHIKNDKQLRDVARVWKKMNLKPVTVYLDGDANGEFEISQQTIDVLNSLNKDADGNYLATLPFTVKPCIISDPDEDCQNIVIKDGGDVKDIAFIVNNAGTKANVVLKAGQTWNWKGTVKVDETGVNMIINKGTMVNAETATLKTAKADGSANNVRLYNDKDASWNINGGILNVQFNVTNLGTVTIASTAQYRQDGTGHIFSNMALTLPNRITKVAQEIGKVVNNGVFAIVDNGVINNYGLIEHANPNAKTYITSNQRGGDFSAPFAVANKMGRINLPYSNKNEDNISVKAALEQGFISVTVNGEVTGALDASVVGTKVNYVIVNSGITEIKAVSDQVKYLEINQPGTELAWNVPATTQYVGLIVLSDVNIKLGTKIIAATTYLGADMYVGGKFNIAAIAAEGEDPAFAATNWSGYYGDTSGAVATKYITFD